MTKRDTPPDTDTGSSHFDHVLGTSLEIQWTAGSGARELTSEVEAAVLGEIARLERVFSTHRADTELSYWLETRGEAMPVSSDLAHVLQSATKWHALTRGGFDPAFASQSPDPEAWSVSREGKMWTARKSAEVELSFDAIAKGYIVDRAAESASRIAGVRDVVINLGGDIRHRGGKSVILGVADPAVDAENARPITRLQIRDHGVATSGGYRRGKMRDGDWHSHLIDPRTGQSADRLSSATVIAPSTEDADALATAFAVLPPEESIAIADGIPGVACLVLDSERSRFPSARWSDFEIPEPSQPPGAPMTRREMLTRFLPAGLALGSLTRSPASFPARVPWDERFELVIDFDFGDVRGGMVARRPYVVVYIDTADGAPVRTVSLWSQQASWVRELRRWHRAERIRQGEQGGDLVMSLASPTRGAGHYSAVWDGRDDQGNLVEQGEFFVCLESIRQGSSSYFTREPFTFETTPFQAQIEDYAGFRNIQLDYRLKS